MLTKQNHTECDFNNHISKKKRKKTAKYNNIFNCFGSVSYIWLLQLAVFDNIHYVDVLGLAFSNCRMGKMQYMFKIFV